MVDRWPRASAEPPIRVGLKLQPDDFQVDEVLDFDPAGEGEHCLLRLEKTGLGTPELATELARLHGIPRMDVGHAGMKDKHAVTRQWFSLAGVERPDPVLERLAGVRLLEQTRHTRKLKPGALAGNRFELRLRAPGPGDVEAAVDRIAAAGVPNYFGEQRFGHDNLAAARHWLGRRRRSRLSRFKTGLYLSVLRSFLFNEVLAARVREASWAEPVDGEVLLHGQPSGPLWGRGRSTAAGRAGQLEQAALEPYGDIRDGLEHAGLRHERRPLVLLAQNLRWQQDAGDLLLSFFLPAGSYATSLLREGFAWDPMTGARAA